MTLAINCGPHLNKAGWQEPSHCPGETSLTWRLLIRPTCYCLLRSLLQSNLIWTAVRLAACKHTGPPITRIVSADSDADESTGTETRQGAYSQHRRIRPKASRRPLKRLRRHGSKGGTPSTNTASFHVRPGSDRYDDGDSEHSDLSMALGEN